MKRFFVLWIAVLFIFAAFPFSFLSYAADDAYLPGTYLVTDPHGVHLYDTYEASLDFKTTAPKGAYLNIIKVSGTFGYTVFDAVYGWVDLRSGVSYVSSMPQITDGEIEGAKGIAITRLPDKLSYIEGEESADIDGLEVSLIFNDAEGSLMKISGYTVAFPDLTSYGEKTVMVYYGDYSASFSIVVNKVPVTGIVLTLPEKTSYVEGEAISFDGLQVTAYFSDGRDEGKGILLTPGEYEIAGVKEGDSSLAPGTYTVTVTYLYPEISASFHIYISEKNVTQLKLVKMPVNPTLYQGQSFRTEDFELSATYDNGITETIPDFDIEYDNRQVGVHTARIYYMGRYVAFDYTVLPLEKTGIELGNTEAVGSYVGSSVNFRNLQVYIVYNSGEKSLTDDYSLSHEIDISSEGQYPVTVTHDGFSAEFLYTVSKRKEVVLGDVDFNGKIEAVDARLALRGALQLEALDDDAMLAADTDFDGNVTAVDARKILRVAVGVDKF